LTVGVPEIHLDTWGLKYVKKKAVLREKYSPALNINENPERARTGQGAHVKIDHHKPPETTNRGGSSSSTQGVDTSTSETKRRGVDAHSSFESAKPSKNITSPNTISDADVKTPDAIETRRETADSGTERTTGATEGSDKKRQQSHGQEVPVGSDTGIEIGARKKLTPRGEAQARNIKNPEGVASGREASNESGIQSVGTRTGSDRYGVKVQGYKEDKSRPSGFRVDPEKVKPTPKGAKTTRAEGDKPKGTVGTVKPTGNPALPKVKAEMELAIIKCKLLSMKTKKHDFIEENKPTRPAYRKDNNEEEESKESRCVSCGQSKKKGHKDVDNVSGEVRNVEDEKYSQGKNTMYNSPHSEAGIQDKEITPHPKPAKGEHTEDTKYFSQTGEELGRGKEGRKLFETESKKKNSDEIVEKAIELINEAYDEMKSSGFKKLKPVYEGDTKEAKKEAPATTGTEGTTNFVYSDVHEANKNTEEARAKETERDAKGTARQRSLKLDEAGAAQAAADKLKPSN